jgi:hypothetical protein
MSGHCPTNRFLGAACFESDAWHKTCLLQQSEPTSFCCVNDDGIVRFSIEQERDHTVLARVGVDECTSVAVNAHWCCFAKVSLMVTGDLHE